jgi:ubiquitin-protein ligase
MSLLEENWNITYSLKEILDEVKNVLKMPNLDPRYCMNQEAQDAWW